jgi:hypothetical protein
MRGPAPTAKEVIEAQFWRYAEGKAGPMAKDMQSIDLSDMSLDELKKLQKDVTKAIDTFKERQRLEALAAVEAKAREMGFSLSD